MNKFINIDYPITKGNSGFFKQTDNTIDSIKSNINILCRTFVGERIFNPNYGLNLHRLLFEPMNDELKILIEDEIRTKLNTYIKNITLKNITINLENNNIDTNTINIIVDFSLTNNDSVYESVEVTLLT